MKEETTEEHESYGMISISRFTGNSEFYGSDLVQNGGVSVTISKGDRKRNLNSDWYHSGSEIIEVNMSHNQYVDAITSGMNTQGVPCTIKHVKGERMAQIPHVREEKAMFTNEMKATQEEFSNRINDILDKLDGNIGKRKAADIKQDLEVLQSHINSNTPFVLRCFNESMEKTVKEAKQSISSYIDNKVHTLGLEAMRDQLQTSIEAKKEIKD